MPSMEMTKPGAFDRAMKGVNDDWPLFKLLFPKRKWSYADTGKHIYS
jgi:hypothetical protein